VKVALVHDWLTGMRGGEKVLEALLDIFPDAPIFTLLHCEGQVSKKIEARKIHTSWIQKIPFAKKHYRGLLPLFPVAVEGFDLRDFDLIVSSSHCVAKGVIPRSDAFHISYVHTPMRYVWDLYHAYQQRGRAPFLRRLFFPPVAAALRSWDVAALPRVDAFVANSENVARRIRRHYGRKADVIYPPVDVDYFTPGGENRETLEKHDHFLIVSALVPYKNIELALQTFRERQAKLTIVGDGPDYRYLKSLAGPTVTFLGRVSDEELRNQYRGARALIFPGEEDFGMTAVEAQACGCPVIALRAGGVPESVIDGKTGILFDEPTPAALHLSIDKLAQIGFNISDLRENAVQFSVDNFQKNFRKFLALALHDSDKK
jgi:glycosyltransferase involved in cell wall biosynthesis